jgi:hypothetical protein
MNFEPTDIIYFNNFSKLHDNVNFIFCKTDFLLQEFKNIEKLDHEITLISGNSDYIIDHNNYYNLLPKNVKKWYAQNSLIKNDIIEPLPIGLTNIFPSYRDGHGVAHHGEEIKKQVISDQKKVEPTKFIYSNFRVETNFNERIPIKKICEQSNFIDWEEPILTNSELLYKFLDYELVVCPQGNGLGDNHRIYEVLYMNRIPITFNQIMYDNLHSFFPVLFLNDNNKLSDYDFLKNKVEELKNLKWNRDMLKTKFWLDKIKNNL